MGQLLRDLKFGCRILWTRPGFTTVALIALALGIGGTTAIFSVVNAVLLRPLPYPEPGRLVAVYAKNSRFTGMPVSYPNFLDWQRDNQSFEEMAAFMWHGRNLTYPGKAERIEGRDVSAGFFSVLRVRPSLGRAFRPQEDHRGAAPVAIISNRLWRSRFRGNRAALGSRITLGHRAYTVIGVLPPGFEFRRTHADVFTPLGQNGPLVLANREVVPSIYVVARLKTSVTLAQARSDMEAVQSRLDELYPKADQGLNATLVPLKQDILGDAGRSLLLLLGAVGLVLLIACANVANLLLAHSSARHREFAIRSALGASRRRVIRQLLTESLLLGLIGGGLGLLVAKWGMRPILAAVPGSLPRSQDIRLDFTVLLFTLAVSAVVGVLFGLAPAFKVSQTNLQESLKAGGRGTTGGQHRAQKLLVVSEIVLTLVLLVAAGLMIRTIRRLWDVNPGFDPQHLLTFEVALSPSVTGTAAAIRADYREMIDRVKRIPGVQSAGLTVYLPLSGNDTESAVWTTQQTPASPQTAPWALNYITTPGYLRTMRIPLLEGRFFTPQDTRESPHVVVIDRNLARRFFPGQDPVGKELIIESWGRVQIVGVAGHVKHWTLAANPYPAVLGAVYFSFWQVPDAWMRTATYNLSIVLRTAQKPTEVIPMVRQAVGESGTEQPVYAVKTMEQIVSASLSSRRFPMLLLEIFAGLALLLAAVGVYGVISYSVSLRTHEIGIRLALGARRADVLRLVVGQGMALVFPGIGIGIGAGLAVTRLLSKLLYGVGPADPVTFILVSIILCAVALAACYIPARRATKVDPVEALRCE
ncbi:MAG: ABC transporter permease [Terriglobia bacterium]